MLLNEMLPVCRLSDTLYYYGVMWCGMVLCCMAMYGMMWHGVVWYTAGGTDTTIHTARGTRMHARMSQIGATPLALAVGTRISLPLHL